MYVYFESFHQGKPGSQDRKPNVMGTWRQKLMHRQWRNAAYCLVTAGLFSLLCYRIWDHQHRGDTTHNGLGHKSKKSQENVLQGSLLQLNLVEVFFS